MYLHKDRTAVTSQYDVHMLKDKDTLSELDKATIKNICQAVRKDTGQPVAEVATARLKMLAFWIVHQD
jgi:hypothetical protein